MRRLKQKNKPGLGQAGPNTQPQRPMGKGKNRTATGKLSWRAGTGVKESGR